MNYILSDVHCAPHFLPLSYTRSVADFRIGITTIRQKWEHFLSTTTCTQVSDYLQAIYNYQFLQHNIIINAQVVPNAALAAEVMQLQEGQKLMLANIVIATFVSNTTQLNAAYTIIQSKATTVVIIENVWDIFSKNDDVLKADFEIITNGRTSATISNSNTIIGNNVFLEQGAIVTASILNSTTGPIYIGAKAEIMEGCLVRGSLALCEGAQLKMGAKIYGATTLGPGCKAGGEVNNSVFFANSSKAHDGFVGNSVIGEWCNLGADTNNSNLKNNYEEVKLWNEQQEKFVKTGLQFCGLIMADHSKCGINTMFNTGTVVGVSGNIFGAGFPRNFIPSFSWGGASGFADYKIDKALQTMQLVLARRNTQLSEAEINMYHHIYELSAKQRGQ
jgi:UDP-N-acetylglucosamine diphosphorylase/glucosamine-1-phosphate N-acetyltransferase